MHDCWREERASEIAADLEWASEYAASLRQGRASRCAPDRIEKKAIECDGNYRREKANGGDDGGWKR